MLIRSSELQEASESELGVFFCDGAGRAVFRDRSRTFNPIPVATFTDAAVSPGVFPFVGPLAPPYDKTRIANDVRVAPAAGDVQIVADGPSRTKYMQRTLAKDGFHVELELNDRRVGVGQLLRDHQSLVIHPERFARIPRKEQRRADVMETVRQLALKR